MRYPHSTTTGSPPPQALPTSSEIAEAQKTTKLRNLIPHFIHEQYQQGNFEGNFDALTMFVDVSGFTKMTQTMMREEHEGAETLAKILNMVFQQMVNVVYERAGFISVFAGDAFTAIFPLNRDNIPIEALVLHVLTCADQIQVFFRQHGLQESRFGEFLLRVKIGISYGDVHWGIIGKEEKAFFFKGKAIDACADAEHVAEKGQIIFDEKVGQVLRKSGIKLQVKIIVHFKLTKQSLKDLKNENIPDEILTRLKLLEDDGLTNKDEFWKAVEKQIEPNEAVRHKELILRYAQKRYYCLDKIPQMLEPPQLISRKPLNHDAVAHFLPDVLMNFKELGEFRHVVPIFISFEGISTIEEMNDWSFLLLENIKLYGGYFNHFDFGDKGGVVICGFGVPLAQGKMIDRALHFILSVKASLKTFKHSQVSNSGLVSLTERYMRDSLAAQNEMSIHFLERLSIWRPA